MVTQLMKRVAARLPPSSQHALRRMFFRRQIRRGLFFADDREFGLLDQFIGNRRDLPCSMKWEGGAVANAASPQFTETFGLPYNTVPR